MIQWEYEITEEQWNRIKGYLPPEKKLHRGRLGKSNRLMLDGIVYWMMTGIPWRDLPKRFGPWQSVYSRFRAWTLSGVWAQVSSVLLTEGVIDEMALQRNGATIKMRQHNKQENPMEYPGCMD